MPGSQPGPAPAAVATAEGTAYADPVTDLADYGNLPPGSPGALMLQGPRAQAFNPRRPAAVRQVITLPPPPGRPGRLVKLPGGRMGVSPSNLAAMSHLATPAPTTPPPNLDPPLGSQVIGSLPDGTMYVLPLPAGFGGADDAGPINTALLQARGTGQGDAFLGGQGTTGGVVRLAANGAVYNVQSTITVPCGVNLIGGGPTSTILKYSGTGPCVYAHGAQQGGSNIQGVGTKLAGFLVDGAACPPGAQVSGVDAGDQYSLILEDITVQNFTSSGTTSSTGAYPLGAVGVNWANYFTLTEKCYMRRVTINNCGTPSTGPGSAPNTGGGAALQCYTAGAAVNASRMYSEIDIHINQQPGQNGLVIARQGHLMNGRFIMRGNMNNTPGGVLNGSAAIVIGVSAGGGGAQAGHIQRMFLDVHVETDGAAGGTSQPFSIYAGANADNTVNKCWGRLQFLDGVQNSNLAVGTNGTFEFSGPIIGGDTVLPLCPSLGLITSGTPITYNGNDGMLYYQASGGAVTAITLNGVSMTNFSSPIPVSAGTQIAFTFPGTISTNIVRVGQGN